MIVSRVTRQPIGSQVIDGKRFRRQDWDVSSTAECIGTGVAGTVYLARHKETGTPVAVKVR